MKRRAFFTGTISVLAGCAGPLPDTVSLEPVSAIPEPQAPLPSVVDFPGFREGELHVFPGEYALYWTLPEGRARRYVVGIGLPGLYQSGTFKVGDKREWPSWTPTRAMIKRDPDLYAQHAGGMPGGPGNPLGARALYLYRSNGTDSLLRIHGTHDLRGLGQQISNGCVRMANSQVIELYQTVPIGARAVLHPA